MSVSREASKIYGYALVGCAVVSTFVLIQHPVLPADAAGSLADAVTSIRSQSVLVHAGAIAFGIVEMICFCGFALMLGIGRPMVLAGLVAWAVGTFALISAAAINGFAVPYLAADFAQNPLENAQLFEALLRFAWALNQTWDKIGLLSWAAAICSWSLLLVMCSGWPRLLGVLGGLSGAAIVFAITSGRVTMDAHGFVLSTAVFSLWTLGAGLLMVNGDRFTALREARTATPPPGSPA